MVGGPLTGLSDRVLAAFESASDATGILERRYRIGGHVVLLRCAGREVSAGLHDAIHHLVETDGAATELTVLAWDASGGISFPAEPTAATTPAWKRSPWFLEFDPFEGLADGPPWHRVTGLIDSNTATYWVSDPSMLRNFERASPLLSPLQRWLSRSGLRVVHAGAVATSAGAALIVGDSGAGKSTTSLACRQSGLGFLGDDHVAVEFGLNRVHSLYSTAKLSWDHPASPSSGVHPVGSPSVDGKALYFLQDGIVTQATLRAIVAPRVVAHSKSGLTRISPGRALTALAPSSVLQLPDQAAQRLADLRQLCAELPAFELVLGSDVDAVGGLVEQALRA
jgi:hypothetical protein